MNAKTISELMQLDESGAVGDRAFDDQLWLILFDLVCSPDELIKLPEPVWVYLASRLIEWEVGNGGFPQAAFNIPEWFPLAKAAYRKLGLERAGDLIQRAEELIGRGEICE